MSFVWYSSTVATATAAAADCRVTYGRRTIRRTILVPQMNDDHRSEVDLYLAYYGQTPSKQYSFLSSSRSFFHWLHHHMKKDILITLIQTIDQLLDRLLAFLFTHSIISRDNQGQKETERREHLGYLERDQTIHFLSLSKLRSFISSRDQTDEILSSLINQLMRRDDWDAERRDETRRDDARCSTRDLDK